MSKRIIEQLQEEREELLDEINRLEGMQPTITIALSDIECITLKSYIPPFTYDGGYIFDSHDNMVIVLGGWGRIQNDFSDGIADQVHDGIGELITKALNAFWEVHGDGE